MQMSPLHSHSPSITDIFLSKFYSIYLGESTEILALSRILLRRSKSVLITRKLQAKRS